MLLKRIMTIQFLCILLAINMSEVSAHGIEVNIMIASVDPLEKILKEHTYFPENFSEAINSIY